MPTRVTAPAGLALVRHQSGYTVGGTHLQTQAQRQLQVQESLREVAPGTRQPSSSSASSSSSRTPQRPIPVHESLRESAPATRQPSSSSASSSRSRTPLSGRSIDRHLTGTTTHARTPFSGSDDVGNQNSGVLGICEDKRKLAECTHQITSQIREFGRRTGVDTTSLEDQVIRPIKKQNIQGPCPMLISLSLFRN